MNRMFVRKQYQFRGTHSFHSPHFNRRFQIVIVGPPRVAAVLLQQLHVLQSTVLRAKRHPLISLVLQLHVRRLNRLLPCTHIIRRLPSRLLHCISIHIKSGQRLLRTNALPLLLHHQPFLPQPTCNAMSSSKDNSGIGHSAK